MSHNPWGPPPPYHPGYTYPHPPPPAPGGYAYVPAPVMMPVPVYPVVHPQPAPAPAPQPSYVPPPQQRYPDPIDWVPATGFSAPGLVERAFVAGKEGWDGSPLCVIRAHHSGELVPGKLAIKHRSAYIPYSGKEVSVNNFELLCVPEHMVHWVTASHGSVPPDAIIAGNTHNAEPLYICRVKHLKSITPGKVHPSHGCAYISFGGSEHTYKHYEVLCKLLCVPEHMVHWVTASHGSVPPDAIIAGNTHNAEPLYICRVKHLKSITPGKVHPSHGCAYISFGGSEHTYKHYEVLCKVNTSTWR